MARMVLSKSRTPACVMEREVRDQCRQQGCHEGGVGVVDGVGEGESGHVACLEIGVVRP